MSVCLNIMLLELQSEQGTWYLKCVWLSDCYYLLVIIKVGYMGEGGQSCSLSSFIRVVVVNISCTFQFRHVTGPRKLFKVIKGGWRSFKGGVLSFSVLVCVSLSFFVCVYMYIFLGLPSQSLIAYKFQPTLVWGCVYLLLFQ